MDNKTTQEKVDGLLEQYTSERDIELQHNPQEEIEARLATLREQGVRPNEGPFISNLHDSDDSEEEIEKITKKVSILKIYSFYNSNIYPSVSLFIKVAV